MVVGSFLNIRDKYEIQDNESQHFFALFWSRSCNQDIFLSFKKNLIFSDKPASPDRLVTIFFKRQKKSNFKNSKNGLFLSRKTVNSKFFNNVHYSPNCWKVFFNDSKYLLPFLQSGPSCFHLKKFLLLLKKEFF